MDKKIKILQEIEIILQSENIETEDILSYTQADINLDSKFIDAYLILTKDNLIMLSADVETKLYNAYPTKMSKLKNKQLEKSLNYEAVTFPLSQCGEMEIRDMATGGIFCIEIDGEYIELAAFTNMYIGSGRRFLNAYNSVNSKGENNNEDEEKGEEKSNDFSEEKESSCPKCGTPYPEKGRRVCPKCVDRRSIFMRTLSYFKPFRVKIVLMSLCFVVVALLQVAVPYLNGEVLYDKILGCDAVFARNVGFSSDDFLIILILFVAMTVTIHFIRQLFGMLQTFLTAKIVPQVVAVIRGETFDSMGRLSVKYFSEQQTGSLMTRIVSDSGEVTTFFIDGLPFLFVNILTIVASVVLMFRLNWQLAMISAILLPILTVISFKLGPKWQKYFMKRHNAMRTLNAQINDNFVGARVVKAFGQEKTEQTRFDKYNTRVRTSEVDMVAFDSKFGALFFSAKQVIVLLMWFFGAYLVISGTGIKYGTLATFAGFVNMLAGPLDFLSFVSRWWANSMNSAGRIFEIIDAKPDIGEAVDPVHIEKLKGDVELKNVSFSYEKSKNILSNVNLKIKAGEMLGIVGRSGAGKSTLVNLISRLYDVNEGAIYIDGVNVKDLSFKSLRGNVAMVSQETYIFMGTVRDNIAYAKPDASYSEVIKAAKAAAAHDFICDMPDGYDTIIGASGRDLSGGERQRVSIARAILANPKILILDEATASVDTETEQSIQSSLDRLVKGRTTISIAHRLSTLNNADHLIVIEEGEIVEEGKHKDLYEQQGVYHKLFELQTKALAMRGIE